MDGCWELARTFSCGNHNLQKERTALQKDLSFCRDMIIDDDAVDITVDKPADLLLGIALADTGFWPFDRRRIVVESVDPASPALDAIGVGAEVVRINGVAASGAAQAAELIRAAGGRVHFGIRKTVHEKKNVGGGQRYPLAVLAVAFALVVLGSHLSWSAAQAWRASHAQQLTQREAREWQKRAKYKSSQVDLAQRAQERLALEASALKAQIALLTDANATASVASTAALSALRAQYNNVTAEQHSWRDTLREAQHQLRKARQEQKDASGTLETERAKSRDKLATLRAERKEAEAAWRRERERALHMRQRIRQRLAQIAAEASVLSDKDGDLPSRPRSHARRRVDRRVSD